MCFLKHALTLGCFATFFVEAEIGRGLFVAVSFTKSATEDKLAPAARFLLTAKLSRASTSEEVGTVDHWSRIDCFQWWRDLVTLNMTGHERCSLLLCFSFENLQKRRQSQCCPYVSVESSRASYFCRRTPEVFSWGYCGICIYHIHSYTLLYRNCIYLCIYIYYLYFIYILLLFWKTVVWYTSKDEVKLPEGFDGWFFPISGGPVFHQASLVSDLKDIDVRRCSKSPSY